MEMASSDGSWNLARNLIVDAVWYDWRIASDRLAIDPQADTGGGRKWKNTPHSASDHSNRVELISQECRRVRVGSYNALPSNLM